MTLEEFLKDRNEALLSLDEKKIREFHRKYNDHDLPEDSEIFWGSVHKCITGIESFPLEFRKASKQYLTDRGLRSHDDGDL